MSLEFPEFVPSPGENEKRNIGARIKLLKLPNSSLPGQTKKSGPSGGAVLQFVLDSLGRNTDFGDGLRSWSAVTPNVFVQYWTS
jgi:hypothetical protein